MADIASNTWFPVVTLLLGYGIKFYSDWTQNRWTTAREREAREAAKHDKLFERRSELQRQSLLELQEAVMQLARATGALNHQDEMALRAGGKWQRQAGTGDVSETFRFAQARISTLCARVRDDGVRDLAGKFRACCTAVVHSESQADSASAMRDMVRVLDELNQQIGKVLRKLDDDDDLPGGNHGDKPFGKGDGRSVRGSKEVRADWTATLVT